MAAGGRKKARVNCGSTAGENLHGLMTLVEEVTSADDAPVRRHQYGVCSVSQRAARAAGDGSAGCLSDLPWPTVLPHRMIGAMTVRGLVTWAVWRAVT
jgi:hypothetical protein